MREVGGRRLPCGHLWAARYGKGLNEEGDRGDLKAGWARAEWRDVALIKFNSWPYL